MKKLFIENSFSLLFSCLRKSAVRSSGLSAKLAQFRASLESLRRLAEQGAALAPPIGVPLDAQVSPFSLSELQVDEMDWSPPSSPQPAPPTSSRRRKVLFTEGHIERRLLLAINDCPTEPLGPLGNNVLMSMEMTEICKNLRHIESMKDNGLIMQAYAIGRIIVDVLQPKIGCRSDVAVVQELKRYQLQGFGKTKVAEAKRFYRLGTLYPRLLNVTNGFTAVELTQAARFIESICQKAGDFWK